MNLIGNHGSHGKPASRRSLPQRVAEQIKQRIVAGEYPLGGYLPSLRDFEQELGVSRRTISGAIELLVSMGLVVTRHGRGTEVVSPGRRATSSGAVLLLSDTQVNGSVEHRHLTTGVADSLSGFGYDCVHQEFGDLPSDAAEAVEPYAGVIFLEAGAAHYADLAVRIEQMRVPVVVANLEIDAIPVSHTCVDHRAIAHAAVKMLIDLGHRRIGFIGREPGRYFYAKALAGYREALAATGIAIDPELINLHVDPPTLVGYRGALRMLTMHDPPSAFFGARDWYAQGIWTAVEQASLVVGRDVSIVGFDDLTWPTDDPQLTTFREPIDELAREAARMLVDRIVSGPSQPQRRVLDAPLVLRRSAGPRLAASNDRADQTRRQLASSLLGIESL
jgi:DNA-binding LacI/PurR family transcriptional regulator